MSVCTSAGQRMCSSDSASCVRVVNVEGALCWCTVLVHCVLMDTECETVGMSIKQIVSFGSKTQVLSPGPAAVGSKLCIFDQDRLGCGPDGCAEVGEGLWFPKQLPIHLPIQLQLLHACSTARTELPCTGCMVALWAQR